MTKKRILILLLLPLIVHFKRSWAVREEIFAKRRKNLVRKWAPLVWLAPGEKFMPDSIEDFLPHTQPGDFYGRMESHEEVLQQGAINSTNKLYLYTVNQVAELLSKNTSSYLHGKDPTQNPVPVYAIVTKCDPWKFHVTYWLFFPYNCGKEICVLGSIPLPAIFNTCLGKHMILGSHVGDFEHVSMSFKTNATYPERISLGTHESGVYYNLNLKTKSYTYADQVKRKLIAPKPKFPREIKFRDKRIELFSSLGSHGLWAEPGDHNYYRWLGIMDSNGYGKPWRTWDSLKIYHLDFRDELPKWMFYKGKWGNPRSNCLLWYFLCEYTDGPAGVLRPVKDFYCDNS